MIQGGEFIGAAKALGFRTWAGVPCSFLTPFINEVIADPEMIYVSSANEGDAVATASGAALAGRPAVALMQNSGLGNAISPLSSLNWVFRIPILLIISLRGESGLPDEPQHELMGQITGGLLDQLQIPWDWFPRNAADIEGALTVATWQMEKTARPYAFIMRKGSVASEGPPPQWQPPGRGTGGGNQVSVPDSDRLTRREVLQCVVESTPEQDSIVIGTTGYTGRELFAVADRPNHFYLVGSMGCASSFGLGLALSLPGKRVVVADGDGAVLMRMGNLATVAAYGGANLCHLLIDNSMHESTGGQSTVSAAVDFAAVARACGYAFVAQPGTASALAQGLEHPAGPAFLHVRIRAGTPDGLPRPDRSPPEVRRRLMEHLGIKANWP